MNFAVDGRKCSEKRARKVFAAHVAGAWGYSAEDSKRAFDAGMVQSSDGYAVREVIEAAACGVTMRHPNEEQS